MSSGKVLVGLLAGIATGVVVGILFAPDKGSATRDKLTKKGREAAEGLKDKFNDFVDQVSESFESEAENITKKAKSSVS